MTREEHSDEPALVSTLIYHHHNNPIVHVFIKLASEAAAARKLLQSAAGDATSTPPRKWANKWRKAAFMALNPKVAVLRATPEEKRKKSSTRLRSLKITKAASGDKAAADKAAADTAVEASVESAKNIEGGKHVFNV